MKDKRENTLRKVLLVLGIIAAFLIGNLLPFKLPGGIVLFVVAITIGIFIGCGLGSEKGFKIFKKEKEDNENK